MITCRGPVGGTGQGIIDDVEALNHGGDVWACRESFKDSVELRTRTIESEKLSGRYTDRPTTNEPWSSVNQENKKRCCRDCNVVRRGVWMSFGAREIRRNGKEMTRINIEVVVCYGVRWWPEEMAGKLGDG